MWPVAFLAKSSRTSVSRSLLLLLASTLGCSGAANASTVWLPGQVTTNGQATWADPTQAGALILNDFATVYASTSGIFQVGTSAGFSILFTDGPSLLAYLPATGLIGPLDSNLVDPTSTASGAFGGEVTALKLNIDFSSAGFTLGTSGIPFGNLVLSNFST